MAATFGVAAVALTELPQTTLYALAAGAFVLSILCSLFTFALVSIAVMYGKNMTLGATFGRAVSLIWPLGVLLCLVYAIVIGGFIALIIPGLVLMVVLMPTLWITIEEGLSAKAAVDRSIALVTGRWWTVMGRLFMAVLVVIGISLGLLVLAIALMPLFFTLAMIDGMTGLIVGVVCAIVGYVLLATVMGIFMTRYMYELYRGLVATAVPQPRPWWQGVPLTILTVIGGIILVVYVVASPYLMVEDMQEELLPAFPESDEDFDDWLEANPELMEMNATEVDPVLDAVPAETI